jgi:hypothetical protein
MESLRSRMQVELMLRVRYGDFRFGAGAGFRYHWNLAGVVSKPVTVFLLLENSYALVLLFGILFWRRFSREHFAPFC